MELTMIITKPGACRTYGGFNIRIEAGGATIHNMIYSGYSLRDAKRLARQATHTERRHYSAIYDWR